MSGRDVLEAITYIALFVAGFAYFLSRDAALLAYQVGGAAYFTGRVAEAVAQRAAR